ncbi:recombination-associated protein RdgC [Desulfosarcina sp. OttesenSCG-928-A07]|nr:recombination-associated protein RdgC [Desulfosarcina sp. OttesenSCG-928-A07]
MGIFSSSVSLTQYHVEGKIDDPVLENIRAGLFKYAISDIDAESEDRAIGWTCFSDPFSTDFDANPFLIGSYFSFSMRIDKKSISSKVIQKHYVMEMKKRLEASGRDFLSKSEKKEIKDHVLYVLNKRVPATPSSYDLIWNYEEGRLLFFSTSKGANEELETLFTRSFKLKLVRFFPYTWTYLASPLSDAQKDAITNARPTSFVK